ncbi:uncharacterized protein VTP21DRAFT_9314 [Calcarisporiella thermophila]|uniref:uncharacterized protein n=1 Tax=Calcarisporiella thermophila TaxID=911321 RepID=UPI00374210FF
MVAKNSVYTIGYVPEHFSTPLFIAKNKEYFKELGLCVELHCCPGGTGEMIQKLKDKTIDVAIALTEGLIAGYANGQDFYRIIGTYVESPLCWAISTGSNAPHTSVDSLRNSTAAVSRMGSGSHIMAYCLADREGWLSESEEKKRPFRFEVLNNFKAMRDGVNDGRADFFLWENFTTKPYHDSIEVRRIGDITPPWPAFLFAASTSLLSSAADTQNLNNLLHALHKAANEFMQHRNGQSLNMLMEEFKYPKEDVIQWLQTVKYPGEGGMEEVNKVALENCVESLLKAGAIERRVHPKEIIDANIAKLI